MENNSVWNELACLLECLRNEVVPVGGWPLPHVLVPRQRQHCMGDTWRGVTLGQGHGTGPTWAASPVMPLATRTTGMQVRRGMAAPRAALRSAAAQSARRRRPGARRGRGPPAPKFSPADTNSDAACCTMPAVLLASTSPCQRRSSAPVAVNDLRATSIDCRARPGIEGLRPVKERMAASNVQATYIGCAGRGLAGKRGDRGAERRPWLADRARQAGCWRDHAVRMSASLQGTGRPASAWPSQPLATRLSHVCSRGSPQGQFQFNLAAPTAQQLARTSCAALKASASRPCASAARALMHSACGKG